MHKALKPLKMWVKDQVLFFPRRKALKRHCAKMLTSDPPRRIKSSPKILVVAHVYYYDMAEHIIGHIRNIPFDVDVIITSPALTDELRQLIDRSFTDARCIETENVGRDVWPFVVALRSVELDAYDLVCKVHTKKSPHRTDGPLWHKRLTCSILGSEGRVMSIVRCFQVIDRLGMVGSDRHLVREMGNNKSLYHRYAKALDLSDTQLEYIGGTMFWCRPNLLFPLRNSDIERSDFMPHHNIDAHPEHALERIMGSLAKSDNTFIAGISEYALEDRVHADASVPVYFTTIECYRLLEEQNDIPNATYAFLYENNGPDPIPTDIQSLLDPMRLFQGKFCLAFNVTNMPGLSLLRKPFWHFRQIRYFFRHPAYFRIKNCPVLCIVAGRKRLRTVVLFCFWKVLSRVITRERIIVRIITRRQDKGKSGKSFHVGSLLGRDDRSIDQLLPHRSDDMVPLDSLERFIVCQSVHRKLSDYHFFVLGPREAALKQDDIISLDEHIRSWDGNAIALNILSYRRPLFHMFHE